MSEIKFDVVKIAENSFRNSLAIYLNQVDKDKVLTADVKKNMVNSYAVFIEQATAKFIRGQDEHGGDIRDRDLNKEMSAELIDLFFYGPFGAQNWPAKPK